MRRPTMLTVAAVAAFVLPVNAALAGPDRAGPEDRPTDIDLDVTQQVTEAARQASAQRQAAPQGHGGPPLKGEEAAALDAATRQLADTEGTVGVTARVEGPDGVWRGAAGARELDRRPPARPQDRFRVASITKSMVATLVMQEVAAGTFTLDTPVNEVVPGMFPAHPDVTVEHLLSHRSGAQTGEGLVLASRMSDPTDWEQFFQALGQDYGPQDYLSVVNAVPWLFEPGTDFSYSNAGYVALGLLLETVTGEDLADLLQERVFQPAGMRHTDYPVDPGTNGPFLVGAAWTGVPEDGGLGWQSLAGFDPDVFQAAGAAVSTTADLNAFTEALITGELVDPALVQDMVTPRSFEELDYGLGVYRLPDPCPAPGQEPWLYGHDGATFGTLSIALTSADGSRQLSIGVTGRDLTGATVPDLNSLLVPMLLASCEG